LIEIIIPIVLCSIDGVGGGRGGGSSGGTSTILEDFLMIWNLSDGTYVTPYCWDINLYGATE